LVLEGRRGEAVPWGELLENVWERSYTYTGGRNVRGDKTHSSKIAIPPSIISSLPTVNA
jgi:hypothetical protein